VAATSGSLLVAGSVVAAGTFAAYYSARAITWAVMTDELSRVRARVA